MDGTTKNNFPSIKMAKSMDGHRMDYGFFRSNREKAFGQKVF